MRKDQQPLPEEASAARRQLIRPRFVAVVLPVALLVIGFLLLLNVSTKHKAQLYCRWCGQTRTHVKDVWGNQTFDADFGSLPLLRFEHMDAPCDHSWFKTSHTSWNLIGRETFSMEHWHDQLVELLKYGQALPSLEKSGRIAEIKLAIRIYAVLGRLPDARRFPQQLEFLRELEYGLPRRVTTKGEGDIPRIREVLKKWARKTNLPEPD